MLRQFEDYKNQPVSKIFVHGPCTGNRSNGDAWALGICSARLRRDGVQIFPVTPTLQELCSGPIMVRIGFSHHASIR